MLDEWSNIVVTGEQLNFLFVVPLVIGQHHDGAVHSVSLLIPGFEYRSSTLLSCEH